MQDINEQRRGLLRASAVGSLGISGLAGCLGTGGKVREESNLGMVYSVGGLGDNSFNDLAHRGVQRAESELGVSYQNAEPDGASQIGTLQRKFARSSSPDYDLVCCIGFTQTSALKENAEKFPDQNFVIVDSVVERDNVASYTFKSEEGSFQVGHLAGLLTTMDFSAGAGQTNDDLKVGFVGGKEIPLIEKFEAGYKAGVKHANSDVEVISAYAGGWNDPSKGQSIANSMYNEGADIVYHAAGGTGNGVFKTAQNQGRYAIGVDADQSKSIPKYSDVILASMVNGIDEAIFKSAKKVVDDEFTSGLHDLGLKEDGVTCVYGDQLGPKLPTEVKDALEASRTAVAAGDIEVPTETEDT